MKPAFGGSFDPDVLSPIASVYWIIFLEVVFQMLKRNPTLKSKYGILTDLPNPDSYLKTLNGITSELSF